MIMGSGVDPYCNSSYRGPGVCSSCHCGVDYSPQLINRGVGRWFGIKMGAIGKLGKYEQSV